ncbi:MAG: DivIVA domain-containing protein [Clostridiales bacterium]|nr:DivIVA domain-containing protein [Clostridiales bacterium]
MAKGEFKKVISGYDPREVDAYLAELAEREKRLTMESDIKIKQAQAIAASRDSQIEDLKKDLELMGNRIEAFSQVLFQKEQTLSQLKEQNSEIKLTYASELEAIESQINQLKQALTERESSLAAREQALSMLMESFGDSHTIIADSILAAADILLRAKNGASSAQAQRQKESEEALIKASSISNALDEMFTAFHGFKAKMESVLNDNKQETVYYDNVDVEG